MSIDFERVDPHSVRDEVVDFFWQHRRWPGETRDDYYALWDWRYTALSEGPAIAYIARLQDTREIVGHIGVYRRKFRHGQSEIQVCVPGNLFVHPDWQQNIVGVRMVMFLRSLIQGREFDAVIGFGNKTANGMLDRLHFAQLGSMHTYVDIRDSGPLLRRRNRVLGALAPVVNLGLAARRMRSHRNRGRQLQLRISKLEPDQFVNLDRSHWAPPDRLVAWESNRFVLDRYLHEPNTTRHLYGLFDRSTGLFEAFLVTEPGPRMKVWNCQTNPAAIDPPSAIEAVAAEVTGAATVLVPTLPQSRLAAELVGAGFMDRETVDSSEAATYLSALWLPDNPHSAVLSDPTNWDIWLGSRHY